MRLRERFVRHFQGEPGLAPPYLHVFGPMRETLERWRGEGMRDDSQWFRDVGFDGEPGKQFGNWVRVNGFVCPEFEPKILARDGNLVTRVNAWGCVVKAHADGLYMDYPLECPVKDERSWQAMKERLRPESGQRFPADWARQMQEYDAAEVPAFIGGLPCGFFGAPRELFGVENWLLCFYDNPRLAHEVLDTLCDLWCAVFGRIAREIRVDFMFIWEDMCYRNGPLLSPAIFREFMLPRYQRLIRAVREAGVPLILVDTDGNCDALTPLFVEAGVDIVIPFEVQAGMDVGATRQRYPDLGMIGGMEKTIPSQGEAAVAAELERIRGLIRAGRYLPCSDHGVPPTVSYSEYVAYYRRLGEVVRNP